MRVLITTFVVLFSLIELSQWVSHFTLPMPVLILAGALLAIASNYGKSPGWFVSLQSRQFPTNQTQAPSVESANLASNLTALNPSSSTPIPKLPRSISFTIPRRSSGHG
ncbi:MAG: hypothetical protein RIM23_23345 [Coleofasciculus sp. G3-WIS-01]|uniref:hypothetical protein n=1 Tax=Coleofasciculus sp. G3-WIS-01 TaxID=3069528 RepID=UPI0032F55186